MWLGKSKVKMKTVTNRVLNILRFLFTVNAELLISKLSSVLDWFINIYYILTSDEDVLRSNISSVIESCWNWKVPYVDYIHKTMYDDILHHYHHACMLILFHYMLILQHYKLKLKHYVVRDTRMPIHVYSTFHGDTSLFILILYNYMLIFFSICWLTPNAKTSTDTCQSIRSTWQLLYV